MQPGAQVGREVARLAVVAGDDDRRTARGERVVDPVEQRRDEVRPQRRRDERATAVAGERDAARVMGELAEEGAQRHVVGHAERPRGCAAGACRSTIRDQAVASMFRRT